MLSLDFHVDICFSFSLYWKRSICNFKIWKQEVLNKKIKKNVLRLFYRLLMYFNRFFCNSSTSNGLWAEDLRILQVSLDSVGFHWISADSIEFQRISLDSIRFHWIPGFHWIPWDFIRFHWIPWVSIQFHWIPFDSVRFQDSRIPCFSPWFG